MASSVTIFQPRVCYSGVDSHGQRQRFQPRPSSAKLSGMKFELYNPRLPTLRRMDMDSVSHKLSSEHSRTTTPCSRDDFIKAKSSPWAAQRTNKLHCKGILKKPTVIAMETFKPHGPSYIDNWNLILSNLKSQATQSKTIPTDQSRLEVSGLAVRSKHPSITSAWQHSRATSAQGSRSRPMPATMYSRYRGTRPFSPNPWK